MSELSLMMFEEGFDRGIRSSFVSDWFRVDSYVSSKECLLSEIEKTQPDVVVTDLDLYEKIDGIETLQRIRARFDVPVMYV